MAGRATENLPGGSLNIPYRIFNQSIYLNVFTVYKHYCILFDFMYIFNFIECIYFFIICPNLCTCVPLVSNWFRHISSMPTCKAEWVEYDGRSDAGPDLSDNEDTEGPLARGSPSQNMYISQIRQFQSETTWGRLEVLCPWTFFNLLS
jgi:hypothetical protein